MGMRGGILVMWGFLLEDTRQAGPDQDARRGDEY